MSAKPANQKRRNNEKRKEKSRVAARCRRTKEMQIFSELTAALPAKKEEVEQLDKASVMRLAISYLRVRDVVSTLPETAPNENELQIPKDLEDVSSELSYMKALDGFVLVLSQQGDIVYCSENIAEHIGVSQMDIMGQSVFEFSHPCDHEEIRDSLRSSTGKREMMIRLKCTLTGKGRNVHLKSASYKVIHVTGHMLAPSEQKAIEKEDQKKAVDGDTEKPVKTGSLIAVGRPIPNPSNIEVPLDSKTFLSKHSLDMKFIYTDDTLQNILGFEPYELVGRSLYDYHHAADSAALAHHFKSLLSKGQCETGQYRFLARCGGYSWVQTQATVITDKQQKPVHIVCVNYVISGIEFKDEIFASHQLQHADLKPVLTPLPPKPVLLPRQIAPLDTPNGAVVAFIPPEEERPIPVTDLIFAPRNKEMNKGYLTFSQGQGTMLKDEPDDLTHLAPTPGDACIALENNPFDIFDDFILGENYCSLLDDDLPNGSPVDSLGGDPILLSSSPDTQETDSSCEQSSLLTDISLEAFDSTRSDDLDGGKSPFIPMTDELPVLEPAVMWGALPDNVSLARPQPSEPLTPAPALQRLLAAPPTGPPPQDLITNIYSDQGLIPNRSVSTWDTGVKRVMSQDEEPTAKRVRRSPSPAQPAPTTTPSSSVLMNLLDTPQAEPQTPAHAVQQIPSANYQLVMNARRIMNSNIINVTAKSVPIQNINLLQVPNQQLPRIPTPANQAVRSNLPNNVMTPLTLNVDNQIFPRTRNYSPTTSPSLKGRNSPYPSPQSLSLAGKLYSPNSARLFSQGLMQTNSDPYLTNKMQQSPPFQVQNNMDVLLDSNSLNAEFWSEDILQDTADILTALDDVKLG